MSVHREHDRCLLFRVMRCGFSIEMLDLCLFVLRTCLRLLTPRAPLSGTKSKDADQGWALAAQRLPQIWRHYRRHRDADLRDPVEGAIWCRSPLRPLHPKRWQPSFWSKPQSPSTIRWSERREPHSPPRPPAAALRHSFRQPSPLPPGPTRHAARPTAATVILIRLTPPSFPSRFRTCSPIDRSDRLRMHEHAASRR